MTVSEASYVLAHRHEYPASMVAWALEVLARAGVLIGTE